MKPKWKHLTKPHHSEYICKVSCVWITWCLLRPECYLVHCPTYLHFLSLDYQFPDDVTNETYWSSEVRWGEVAQLCPTLWNPIDCSLPGSSVHGIFQATVLEWVAISISRGSSQPRDRIWVSHIVGRRFTIWATMWRVHHEKCWAGWSTSWNQNCWEKYQ